MWSTNLVTRRRATSVFLMTSCVPRNAMASGTFRRLFSACLAMTVWAGSGLGPAGPETTNTRLRLPSPASRTERAAWREMVGQGPAAAEIVDESVLGQGVVGHEASLSAVQFNIHTL